MYVYGLRIIFNYSVFSSPKLIYLRQNQAWYTHDTILYFHYHLGHLPSLSETRASPTHFTLPVRRAPPYRSKWGSTAACELRRNAAPAPQFRFRSQRTVLHTRHTVASREYYSPHTLYSSPPPPALPTLLHGPWFFRMLWRCQCCWIAEDLAMPPQILIAAALLIAASKGQFYVY